MKKRLSYKLKIFILLGIVILFLLGMFVMGFQVMALRNDKLIDDLSAQTLELEILKREQQSVLQGQKDLAELEKASYPPERLFSNDTNLVNEIQQLESEASTYGLSLNIAISGSTKTAVKLKGTKGELYIIPYVATLRGDFNNVMKFIQSMEHMSSVTHANQISLSTNLEEGTVATINSEFYLKK
jgi:hypothetical protein